MTSFKQSLREFRDDEGGLIMAEFLIVLPVLVWALLAFTAYWDVFRSMNTAQKAGYAISDLISRQNNDLPASFIDGMKTVMEFLLPATQSANMRFTSVKWSTPNNRFEVIWSRSPQNAMPQHTTATLQGVANKIPVMAPADTVMIVETSVPYTPLFDVGLTANYSLDEFIVTRPRFLSKICLQSVACT